jgi:predicted transcriptional regulator of viral defense system
VPGSSTKLNAAIRLVKRKGTIRPRDLAAYSIPADYLDRLHRRGVIERVARGVYAWPDQDVTEHHSLAEATRSVPAGVVCLLSALQFHSLTTQAPHEVWLALPNKAWIPKLESPKLRIMRFSGPALTDFLEHHLIEKVTVRVYTPAKTVADCFKFRNTVGLDVAIEALRDCWQKRKATMNEMWAAARVCRMANVMRPYIESLV